MSDHKPNTYVGQFQVRGDSGSTVIIQVGPRCDIPTDLWEGSLVASHIEIKLIGYHVSFDGCLLRTDEIVRFLGELEALYNSLSGIAELRTMEGTIYLRAAVDTLGHIHWEGHTIYPPWNGNSLSFRFTSDQTFLPDLIQGLTDTMKALHMIGKRP